MDDKKSKIIDRILKLFKLGGENANTTEHEMLLAVTKARQMMAEHQVSMAEIELAKGTATAQRIEVVIRERSAYTRAGGTLAKYDHAVANAVSILTDTRAILYRKKKTLWQKASISMTFIGDEQDTLLASELFMIWLVDVRRRTRAVYGNEKNGWSDKHTSYAVGMGVRMMDRARQQVHMATAAKQQTWGLVLASKQEALARFMDKIPPGKKDTRQYDSEAFNRGYMDGGEIAMGTKVVK
jgi:hypothetical protein